MPRKNFPRMPEPEDSQLAEAYMRAQIEDRDRTMARDREFAMQLSQIVKIFGQEGSVLDIASGIGGFPSLLAECFPEKHVYSIDNDPIAVEMAKEKHGDRDNLTLRVGDAHNLSNYYGMMSVVTSLNAFHHLRLDDVVNQIKRCLQPLGIVYIFDLDRDRITEGVPERDLDALYEMRQRQGDQKTLEFLKREGLFDTHRKRLKLASYFSSMAAYTSQEVMIALQRIGLQSRLNPGNDPVYNIIAVKSLV